jgi:hypothetical protein
MITAYIITQSTLHQIEPEVALAIAQHESHFNPNKVGTLGEIGIFQLRPEFWVTGGKNWKLQIESGILALREYKKECKPFLGNFWYLCFNVGPTNARKIKNIGKGPYATKIEEYKIHHSRYLSSN